MRFTRKKKEVQRYESLDYPMVIERMDDGTYRASIPLIKGCKGYAQTPTEAIDELNEIKKTLIELMLEQGKAIPEPTVQLEIPLSKFSKFPNRRKLKQFIK